MKKLIMILMLMMPVMVFGQIRTTLEYNAETDSSKYGKLIANWELSNTVPTYTLVITLDLLIEYKQYCEADSILIGYRFILDEGKSWQDAWEVYNENSLNLHGYLPYLNYEYTWGSPASVWEDHLRTSPYHKTYIRCEVIRVPVPVTFDGFRKWLENKNK